MACTISHSPLARPSRFSAKIITAPGRRSRERAEESGQPLAGFDAGSANGLSGARELLGCSAPSGDGHQECLGGVLDELATAASPVEVGSDQAEALGAPETADGGAIRAMLSAGRSCSGGIRRAAPEMVDSVTIA
ncbi:MAG: hypothetical protein ACRDSH_09390 [Pseudonocardiaceae bacterium]